MICNCHYLIHNVMLYSQNDDLWDACESGDVTEVKRLLSLGADANHHNPRDVLVSCV